MPSVKTDGLFTSGGRSLSFGKLHQVGVLKPSDGQKVWHFTELSAKNTCPLHNTYSSKIPRSFQMQSKGPVSVNEGPIQRSSLIYMHCERQCKLWMWSAEYAKIVHLEIMQVHWESFTKAYNIVSVVYEVTVISLKVDSTLFEIALSANNSVFEIGITWVLCLSL